MIFLGLGIGINFSATPKRQSTSEWDSDALVYISKVESADGEPLSEKVKLAINQFVKRCKEDNSPVEGVSNWDAIKSMCLLAGPKTLDGSLVALRGPDPTNFNFVSGDYNSTLGLKNDGTTKYLDANINNNSVPQDSRHLVINVTDSSATSGNIFTGCYVGHTPGSNVIFAQGSATNSSMTLLRRFGSSSATGSFPAGNGLGVLGGGRVPSDLDYVYYVTPVESGRSEVESQIPMNANIYIFRYSFGNAFSRATRISFYSFGEAVDLVKLKDAIDEYMASIA